MSIIVQLTWVDKVLGLAMPLITGNRLLTCIKFIILIAPQDSIPACNLIGHSQILVVSM